MCKKVTCSECLKPGYMGCGDHAEEALKDVAEEDRCSCRPGGQIGPLYQLLDDQGTKR